MHSTDMIIASTLQGVPEKPGTNVCVNISQQISCTLIMRVKNTHCAKNLSKIKILPFTKHSNAYHFREGGLCNDVIDP